MQNSPVRWVGFSDQLAALVVPDISEAVEERLSALMSEKADRVCSIRLADRRGIVISLFFGFFRDGAPNRLSIADETLDRIPIRDAADLGKLFKLLAFDKRSISRFFQKFFSFVVPSLRLSSANEICSLLRAFSEMHCGNGSAAQISSLQDAQHGVIAIRSSTKLDENNVVVFLGNNIATLSVQRSVRRIKEKNATLFCVGNLPTQSDGGYLWIFDQDDVRLFKTNVHTAKTPGEFHDLHVRRSPDILSAYALIASPDELVVLNAAAGRDAGEQHRVSLKDQGLEFRCEKVVTLENGVFVSGWYYDPNDILKTVEIMDYSLSTQSVSSRWKRAPDVFNNGGKPLSITRFSAFLPRKKGHGFVRSPRLQVTLNTGANYPCKGADAGPDPVTCRSEILNVIKERDFDNFDLTKIYAPAVQRLQTQINRRQGILGVRSYGRQSTRATSIIIPIYRNLSFLRTQLTAFAVDEQLARTSELVFVLDDPALKDQFDHLIGGFAQVYDLDIKVVTLKRNGGYALANNFGASVAEGRHLVLMNSDVVPERPSWLGEAITRLGDLPTRSVIGPKLIYADETLQHAGMYFMPYILGFWQNMHFYKGYSRDFPPANIERIVPAVTGACMIMEAESFKAVDGFTSDYVIGDYEDSDICLKLRQAGGECLYMPSLTLFHFERQSMSASDVRSDSTSTVYNRALHSLRWSETISDLMEKQDWRPRP